MAMRSSATRSKILILTKAVWGLAAEMEGVEGALRCDDRDRSVDIEAEVGVCAERNEDVDGEAALWLWVSIR